MSKSKRPQWVRDYYNTSARRPTSGPRGCAECHAAPYTAHAARCPKTS